MNNSNLSESLLTIGIPVFNGEKTISKSIDSLLKQTFGDFKLIISDNASTDSTQKICEDYAKKDNVQNYEVIISKGVKVFIEPSATMFLIGSEMDYSKDKLTSRFVFNNPNEKSSCGCGESFNI